MNGSEIIAKFTDKAGAVTRYVRIPIELQRVISGGCRCDECKTSKDVPRWDTLAVPERGFTWTVHMPNPAQCARHEGWECLP